MHVCKFLEYKRRFTVLKREVVYNYTGPRLYLGEPLHIHTNTNPHGTHKIWWRLYKPNISSLSRPTLLKLWHLCHKIKNEIEKSLTDQYTPVQTPQHIVKLIFKYLWAPPNCTTGHSTSKKFSIFVYGGKRGAKSRDWTRRRGFRRRSKRLPIFDFDQFLRFFIEFSSGVCATVHFVVASRPFTWNMREKFHFAKQKAATGRMSNVLFVF